jgi:small-conductance mechanosensitive channel
VCTLLATGNPSSAQDPPVGKGQPQKIEDLLKLLGDPEVQKWLEAQKATAPAPAKPAATEPTSDFSFAKSVIRIREHFSALIAAIPILPAEGARAVAAVGQELDGRGAGWMILLFAVFIGAGFAVQWAFWQVSRGWREWIAALRLETIRERLLAMTGRLVWSACYVLAFAVGSLGAFLAFEWPTLIREIMIGYLFAVVLFLLARVFLEFLLSPSDSTFFANAERIRVIPMSNETATFWVRRLSYAAGWFAFGWITVRLLGNLGFSRPSQQLVAYTLELVLLLITLEAVWRRPGRVSRTATGSQHWWVSGGIGTWLWSVYFFSLWLAWVASASRLFSLLVVSVALPGGALLVQRSIRNILRSSAGVQPGQEIPSVLTAIVERGLRALLIVLAIFFLAHAWGMNMTMVTANDAFAMRAVRGAFTAAVILLIADLAWYVVKILIDRRLATAQSVGEPGSEEERRKARIRTLLPILRNVLMIIVVTVAILMALSSLGVEIGPLIAGAGVVGVAVGFGAQTVVKDVISGMFYLLDDAFRVGEYIQSGNYKGTVESFSLRSVKLRHHRGAIYVVPFSELGAIQNMSRDWVIEKITLTVTYDSDVEKARKLVKKIGLELAEDPEFKASTLEPLKMQGVDDFGDSGMVLRMKLKTRPGEQFGIKRRAFMMIKKAFDENGIKVAVPTVQVASGDQAEVAAAAQRALAMHKVAAMGT